MTREAFIEVLDEKGYSYKLDGNKIVVTYKRYVYLESLFRNFFRDWKGNIKGIDSKRLLNKMIESGLFDRR